MSKIKYFTESGLKKLNDELHYLKTKGRKDIANQIAEARDKIATAMCGLKLMEMNKLNEENRETASQSSILLEEAMNCLSNIV